MRVTATTKDDTYIYVALEPDVDDLEDMLESLLEAYEAWESGALPPLLGPEWWP